MPHVFPGQRDATSNMIYVRRKKTHPKRKVKMNERNSRTVVIQEQNRKFKNLKKLGLRGYHLRTQVGGTVLEWIQGLKHYG